MLTKIKIGTVEFPENTLTSEFAVAIKSKAVKFEGEDLRIYSYERPIDCLVSLTVFCPQSETFRTDLITFFNTNRYTLFDVVDPQGYPLTNCLFRQDNKLSFRASLQAKDTWNISLSFYYTDFAADDSIDISDYPLIWQGGDESEIERVSEGVASDNSTQLWRLSPIYQSREYGFEWLWQSRQEFGVWNIAQHYADKFYKQVVIPAIELQPDGFTGTFDGNALNFSLNSGGLWRSSKMKLVNFA